MVEIYGFFILLISIMMYIVTGFGVMTLMNDIYEFTKTTSLIEQIFIYILGIAGWPVIVFLLGIVALFFVAILAFLICIIIILFPFGCLILLNIKRKEKLRKTNED